MIENQVSFVEEKICFIKWRKISLRAMAKGMKDEES